MRLKLSSQDSESKLTINNLEGKLSKSKSQYEDLNAEMQLLSQQFADVIGGTLLVTYNSYYHKFYRYIY